MTTDSGSTLIDTSQAAAEFAAEVQGHQERKKKTLLDTPDLQLFLLYVKPNGYVPIHKVEGPITVHTLVGRLRMKAQESEHDMPAGTVLALRENVSHDVFGEEESVALVTLIKQKP